MVSLGVEIGSAESSDHSSHILFLLLTGVLAHFLPAVSTENSLQGLLCSAACLQLPGCALEASQLGRYRGPQARSRSLWGL